AGTDWSEVDHDRVAEPCAKCRYGRRRPKPAARACHCHDYPLARRSVAVGSCSTDGRREPVGFVGPTDQFAGTSCERGAGGANGIIERDRNQWMWHMACREQHLASGHHDVAWARSLDRRGRNEEIWDGFEHAGDLLDNGAIVVRDDDAEALGGHGDLHIPRNGEVGGTPMLRAAGERQDRMRVLRAYRVELLGLLEMERVRACGAEGTRARTRWSPWREPRPPEVPWRCPTTPNPAR